MITIRIRKGKKEKEKKWERDKKKAEGECSAARRAEGATGLLHVKSIGKMRCIIMGMVMLV